MSVSQLDAKADTTIERIRQQTRIVHERLEGRLDAVERLADPQQRGALIERFAALHIPADAALSGHLAALDGLDFAGRQRAPFFPAAARSSDVPPFPVPASRAEALGMLYVLEGSTLGGRMIMRSLAARGVQGDELGFLDPYGDRTGQRWRDFLAVLVRETESLDDRAEAVRGAERGFAHAERILCEGLA